MLGGYFLSHLSGLIKKIECSEFPKCVTSHHAYRSHNTFIHNSASHYSSQPFTTSPTIINTMKTSYLYHSYFFLSQRLPLSIGLFSSEPIHVHRRDCLCLMECCFVFSFFLPSDERGKFESVHSLCHVFS